MSDTPEDSLNKASEEANALAGIFSNLKTEMKNLSKAMGDSLNPLAGINQSMSAQIKSSKTLLSLSKSNLLDKNTEKNLLNELNKIQGQTTAITRVQNGLDKEILKKTKEVSALNKKGFTQTQLKHNFVGKALKAKAAELEILKKAQALNTANLNSTKELGNQMTNVHGEARKVNNAGKGFQQMADSLKKLPVIGNTMATGFEAAAKASKEAASEGKRFPKMRGAVAGVSAVADQFLSIPAILGQIITLMTSFDKNAVDLSKSMNMSYEEGHKLDEKLLRAGNKTKDLVSNHGNLIKAQQELNEHSGIYHERSVATLATHAQLTERMGLTSKESARFEKFANATGKDFGKLAKSTALIGVNMGKANGLNFNSAKLMKEVAGTSATISSNLGNDPKNIMKAVVAAKLLGTSLENVAAAGSKMVDFESSISKELEAELLIGKDLNLERARALSLAGDMTGLAQELQEQVGTEAEWLEMNVIQRQSLADSIGLSVEQMGEMFLTQEEQKALAEEQAQLQQDELDRNALQLTMLQEVQLFIERIKGLYKEMFSGELREIMKSMKSWVTDSNNIVGVMDKVKLIFKAIEVILFTRVIKGIIAMGVKGVASILAIKAAKAAAHSTEMAQKGSEVAAATAKAAAEGAAATAASFGAMIPVILGGVAEIAATIGAFMFFADGGVVPGTGNSDTVPAMLTPGEIVLNASQQQSVAGAIKSEGGEGIDPGLIYSAVQNGIASVSFTQNLDGVEQGQTYAKLEALNGGYATTIA